METCYINIDLEIPFIENQIEFFKKDVKHEFEILLIKWMYINESWYTDCLH